jgi:hypothetical protein
MWFLMSMPVSDRPVLTIVTPTYNRLCYLQQFLQSVTVELGGLPIEVIIVDDASDDGSWEWLQIFRGTMTVPIRSVRLSENRGPGPARNTGLDIAEGDYFCPLDSDMVLLPGAKTILETVIRSNPNIKMFFFPCIEYPALRRLDSLRGNRTISRDDLLYENVRGELIPVVKMRDFRERGLRYPEFRSGGEGILWIQTLEHGPALFVDEPIVYYRTDVPNRLCTAGHQLRRAAELAEIADAMIDLFPAPLPAHARHAMARRLMASGTYHLLAGNSTLARERLRGALGLGNLTALTILAASVLGVHMCRAAFRLLRPVSTARASLGPALGIREC